MPHLRAENVSQNLSNLDLISLQALISLGNLFPFQAPNVRKLDSQMPEKEDALIYQIQQA